MDVWEFKSQSMKTTFTDGARALISEITDVAFPGERPMRMRVEGGVGHAAKATRVAWPIDLAEGPVRRTGDRQTMY